MPKDTNSNTLADALALLEMDTTLSANKKRDLRSAITRVATWLDRAPEALPTDARALRSHLEKIHPAQAGISAKSLSNVKANLGRALQRTGHIPEDDLKSVRLSPAWQDFFVRLSRNQSFALMRLGRFASLNEAGPQDVSDETMRSLSAYLDARILNKDPEKLLKEIAQAWNGHVSRLDLPYAKLAYNLGVQYRCRPLADYSSTIQNEIAEYLERMGRVDIFSDDGPDKPLRPATLRNIEAHFRQYLDALILGGLRIEDMTSLRDLMTADQMKIAFRATMRRHGTNAPPSSLQNIAATLQSYAKHVLKLDGEELQKIARIKKSVTISSTGMSQKNMERLTQFRDVHMLIRFISLPETLMERAQARKSPHLAALDAMNATAIALLLSAPMRMKNLASLDLDRHLRSQKAGTRTHYMVLIDPDEVKNGVEISANLNPRTSRLLQTYIREFQPKLSVVQTSALFPQQNSGKPRTPDNLGSSISSVINRELGLDVHPHLFRHLSAYLYLNENPGDYETIRRFLGHKRLDTTLTFYASITNEMAQKRYDEVVLSKFGGRDA